MLLTYPVSIRLDGFPGRFPRPMKFVGPGQSKRILKRGFPVTLRRFGIVFGTAASIQIDDRHPRPFKVVILALSVIENQIRMKRQ